MSEKKRKFDPNRPRSTPPTTGRDRDEVAPEERHPSSSDSEAGDEVTGKGLSRTAEADRNASEAAGERRKRDRPKGSGGPTQSAL